VEFQLLGPLAVVDDDGHEITLRPGRQRALLALLVLRAEQMVSSDVLVEELWGEAPPPTALKMLRNQVSGLRRALGPGTRLETRPGGYRLRLAHGERDIDRFEQLLAHGQERLGNDPEAAAANFRDALALWRGQPLADFAYEPFAQTEVARLEERWLLAFEGRVEAELALGRHSDLVAELEVAVAQHPLRERLHGQLMLALYRSDRQADALQAYQDARRMLVDELGIEPGADLRRLHQAILTQDADLEAPVAATPRPSRLPVPPSRLIGRSEDCAQLVKVLRGDDVRLVTLVGPGGVGKTSLALHVAHQVESEFPDGAWFVELAPAADPGHVPSAIAKTLSLRPLPGEPTDQAVMRFLGPKRALVVLDNFEHLLGAASLVSELLSSARRLVVLTTSREALRLRQEQRYTVAPRPVPAVGQPTEVEQTAAGALFVERARSHNPDFEPTAANADAIIDICRRVDGLPLAIELAAARTSLLTAEELNGRLAEAFDALGSGPRDAPARQRTLRATIDWSHRLLSTREAETFARLSVFAGGATVEAAQDVTGADLATLEGLVDKQLLLRQPVAPARLVMLETVREYARERLSADDEAMQVHLRHCLHYLALAERAEPELFTHGEAEALRRLDTELHNLRAALHWSLHHGESGLTLRIAGQLAYFWNVRGMSAEGLGWVEAALDAGGNDASIGDRASGRRAQTHLLAGMGAQYDKGGLMKIARESASEAVALSRQAGDPQGLADALLAQARLDVANSLPQPRRRALAAEALGHARAAGDKRLVAAALSEMALALPPQDKPAELEEAASAFREIGGLRDLVTLYFNVAYNAIKEGRPDLARPFLERSLSLARELGEPRELAFVWGNVGLEALFGGDVNRARAAFTEELRLCRDLVDDSLAPEGLAGMSAVTACCGDAKRAARLLGAAVALGPIADADVAAQLEREFFRPARRRYGEERWSEAQAAGGVLNFQEAIDLALAAAAPPKDEDGL
jgi:predicted ATPase/DNA-binding SARP family transcriptional activator